MSIKVNTKLYATLQRYNPEVAAGESFEMTLPESSSIGDLIEKLNIREREVKITYVNGRARSEMYRLQDGDEVGIFPPVGGG